MCHLVRVNTNIAFDCLLNMETNCKVGSLTQSRVCGHIFSSSPMLQIVGSTLWYFLYHLESLLLPSRWDFDFHRSLDWWKKFVLVFSCKEAGLSLGSSTSKPAFRPRSASFSAVAATLSVALVKKTWIWSCGDLLSF